MKWQDVPGVIIVLGTVLIALTSTGCGTSKLQVRVSVLDTEYLDQFTIATPVELIERQASAAEKVIESKGSLAPDTVDDLVRDAGKLVGRLETKLRAAGVHIDSSTAAIAPEVQALLADALVNARKALSAGIVSVRAARRLSPDALAEAGNLYADAQQQFVRAANLVDAGVRGITDEISNLQRVLDGAELEPEVVESLEARLDELGAAIRRLTSDARADVTKLAAAPDLRGDPLLSRVLNAPEEYWQGRFNHAFAYAKGTNSDIAIVMDDVDKFSIKGLRVDSSAASKATFAALTRVMEISAMAAGVPVAGVLPESNAPVGASGSSVCAEAQARTAVSKAALDHEIRAASARIVRLLDAVLREGPTTLDAGPNAEARARIATAIDSVAAAKPAENQIDGEE